MKFKECRDGLYLFDSAKTSETNNIPVNNYSKSHCTLLNKVANNKQIYTRQEI